MFGRCRRSAAAVTPVKYECDSGNLTGNFARSKILLTERLANGALVTPTPDEHSCQIKHFYYNLQGTWSYTAHNLFIID